MSESSTRHLRDCSVRDTREPSCVPFSVDAGRQGPEGLIRLIWKRIVPPLVTAVSSRGRHALGMHGEGWWPVG